jgi:3-oxoacyl-[acyl-carrier protein] reductase
VDLGLVGRVALVSGASTGLGFAIASALAAEGAHVAIGARGAERLFEAQALLEKRAVGRVVATPIDIRDPAAAQSWVDGTAETFGALHIVVANSGGPVSGPPSAFGVDAYREALEVCLLPHVGLVQAALPHLRAGHWGRILLVASETIKQPTARYALSSTARPGLVGFAKALVHELGPSGITVNVLAPGYHRTPTLERMALGTAGADVERALETMVAHIPLRRAGRSEDFGAIAAFLASDYASFIHGSVLLVDGGATPGY